jgi:hypothetical protein
LAEWKQLHSLNLRGIDLFDPRAEMLDCILALATNIGDNLRSLTMDARYLTDPVVEMLVTGCGRLETLCLENGARLTDETCRALGKYCRSVKTLQLRAFPRLTADGIGSEMLRYLKQLQVLDMSDTAVDSNCLRCLPFTIQKLHFNSCKNITARYALWN